MIGAASYGTNPIFAVPLYRDGMDPDSVLFFRYALAIPLVMWLLARRHTVPPLSGGGPASGCGSRLLSAFLPLGGGRRLLLFAVMGLLMAFSSLFLFQSYNYMSAGIASTMLFVYPIMVAVIMALFFHERFSLRIGICLCMALAGILLLYKGDGGATLSLRGTMLVMASSLSYALYIVGTSRRPLRDLPSLQLTLFVLLFGMFLFAGRLLWKGALLTPTAGHWYLWFDVVALAVFPTLISFLCTTAAIQQIGSTPTAILGAFEPVSAVVLGILFLGESLTLRDAAGMMLILAAVTLVVAGARTFRLLDRLRPKVRLRRHS